MKLEKYSFGVGDRFGLQGKAQLLAFIKAKKEGINIVPVWNKSYREHQITKTSPEAVRKEAEEAVSVLGWRENYYLDADHINIDNVGFFIEQCNFFTLDVCDYINKNVFKSEITNFVEKNKKYIGSLTLPGLKNSFQITEDLIEKTAKKYLRAIKEAGKLYRYIKSLKGEGNFITEISMDETEHPQTPIELFFILSAIAQEGIPLQTIAPKFTGCFYKGIDYVGDVAQFAREFEEDIAVITYAVKEFNLPENLKLSIHSGSDKFSIYESIRKSIKKFDVGLHLKTSGTTWLEELTGLAMSGNEGLELSKKIYKIALSRFDELCEPYKMVINIDRNNLPSPETVLNWSSEEFVASLVHDPTCKSYNPDFRQFLHVSYKIAAEMGQTYLKTVAKFEDIIAKNVTENIYRHIKHIFI